MNESQVLADYVSMMCERTEPFECAQLSLRLVRLVDVVLIDII